MFSTDIELRDNPLSRAERDACGKGNRLSLRFRDPDTILPADWRCVMMGSYHYGHRAPYNFVCSFGEFDSGNAVQVERKKGELYAYRIQFYGAWEAFAWPQFLETDPLTIVKQYHEPDLLTLFLRAGWRVSKPLPGFLA